MSAPKTDIKSSHDTLGRGVFGTDALDITKLFDVKGWVAIVTGGGTGLGLVTAGALAKNGATVYITGRRPEPLQEAVKTASPTEGAGKIIPVQADMSSKEGILKLKEVIEKEEKWVNVLINNHGVSLDVPKINEAEQTAQGIAKKMFEDETFESWADGHRINTASYYFTTFAFLPLLDAAQKVGKYSEPGNVLNISSVSGITKTSQRGQFSYNSNKAATISLSHQLATEFARRGLGIRVNVVCPGYFPSGMSPVDEKYLKPSEEFKQKYGTPLGRSGNAQDYAQCIFGLINNQYVTGAEVVIDGGWLLVQAF
ncbi:short-chain dehydrogenase [Cryptococcus wingfieldii CBS 7118]|uniref:Short-chain dehydrogenase n=1 Tax=Cryptococcus wingfieldii CBS 7118 TaxID=1295528 RepID=A0A1E3K2J3_9TREE|nr:short-chain dehydrogenase [Cryptococcus wingfieldii CBS 7118]ODO07226.1 short-chain dehydrogenase [Cryptococcus wingfieldii CBS 7118]